MGSLHDECRPGTFDEVYGHEDIIESLKHVVEDKRAKTFIFTGPSGVGKTTLARIMADEFAGGNASPTNIIDIDAATNTGVESVRKIAAGSLYKAIGSSKTKTIIMDEAHMLSKSAWSSLLKPIEEPPAHVYWIFCTTDEGRIPDTIRTRCIKYELKPLDEEILTQLLDDVVEFRKFDVIEGLTDTIAEYSQGSPRQALTYLEKCMYCETIKEALSLMRASGQSKEIIDLCRFLIKPRGRSWQDAMKLLKKLEGNDAESIRIVISNYFASAVINNTNKKRTLKLLHILECFEDSYNQSDKFAPLLLSIARALEIE